MVRRTASVRRRQLLSIPFNDLRPLHGRLCGEIDQAVRRVLERGWFILGPEVESFETAFAAYHGVQHAVGVANGTDAIELALRASGIGPGDEVITVSHTAVATVCAVERTGATPVLVDIDPNTYTMDPEAARAAITARTRALLPVHLYGHPADVLALSTLAKQHGLVLVEDCAQAHGARVGGQLVGTFGKLASFSFYPTKNLGAYGDGGAVITDDSALAERLRRLRNYGQVDRYQHRDRGVNSRLDEIQAAILAVKLAHLDEHNRIRREIASWYHRFLKGLSLTLPVELGPAQEMHHVYHLFVVRTQARDRIRVTLKDRGVGTLIHYPIPIHRQPAYADLGYGPGSLPVTERVASEVLSLPLYVGLRPEDVETIAEAIQSALREIGH
jgi:dTDP-4-amino-4,6-dideoxygalactose transaminase